MSKYSRDGYDEKTVEVPEFVFIGSNFHNYEDRPFTTKFTIEANAKDFPRNVTLGFRNNFWRVFASLTEHDRDDHEFEWLGRRWMFVSFWVADSSNVDFASYLDEKRNTFLIFIIKPLYDDRHIPIRRLIFDNGMDEQSAITSLIEAFRGQPYHGYLQMFRHRLNLSGLFTWTASSEPVSIPSAVAFFSFYSFCLLMIWKLAREQTHINIAVESRDLQEQLRTVMRMRSQIINVERYFLTQNISNDRLTNLIARDIRDRFGLVDKFNRFLPLNESIERHLQTAIQMRADLKSTILNYVALSVAAIGLPVSFLSMLLAFNPDATVVKARSMMVMTESLDMLISATLFTLCLAATLSWLAYIAIKRLR